MNSYQAQIQSTTLQNGILTIVVQYTSPDGTDVFTENITTATGHDDNWLDTQITNRLNTLNMLLAYQAIVQTDPMMNNAVTVDPATQQASLSPISVSVNPQMVNTYEGTVL